MKKVTNLNEYMDRVNLELCLHMIEDAYQDFQSGAYDLAEAQLKDILDTFERPQLSATKQIIANSDAKNNNIIPFQK